MTTAARKDSDQRDEDAPVEPNARLTADVAVVLLVLFVVQIGTVVIGVTSHLTLHVMVGLLLVPPLLVKISSVSWRFVRYYRHDEAYRRKGPPALVLRALSPVFLVVTLVLFISGIVLLLAPSALGGPHGTMLRIHAVSFFLWLLLLLAHLAGHARDLRHLALKDWARRTRVAVPGSTLRQSIVLASLAAGLALALSLVGQVGTFQKDTQPHARHSALAECDRLRGHEMLAVTSGAARSHPGYLLVSAYYRAECQTQT
jgi:hypothetical protein